MSLIVFKSLKSTFGSKSFKLAKPSNGTYLKLILSSLSKKGNWGNLLKKFSNLTLRSRIDNNGGGRVINETILRNKALTSYVFDNNLASKPLLLSRVVNKFFFVSGYSFSTNKKRLLATGALSVDIKNPLSRVFTSLRAIHSIFYPISVSIELKSKRRGGRVFSVPVPVKSAKRRHSIFIRWFKKSIIEQSGASVDKFLKEELSRLVLRQGKSIEQLSALEKSIKLNRVFLRKSQIKLV